ncbi:cupin domain-containing protein [Lysinibacillus sp. LZ02]|uniref:cupin domain-containing protein n=1 Tax=Lysinibacillus sp. LZ02 TaxID=3420668 RepID=UPI003D368AEB
MKFFKFDMDLGMHVTHFDSNFFITPFAQLEAEAKISLFTLRENGGIGFHKAIVPQLLVVLAGEGYVRNDIDDFVQLSKGEAVLWEAGEWHETKSDNGLIALVIESINLNNNQILLEAKYGIQH